MVNPFPPGTEEHDAWARHEAAEGAELLDEVRAALRRYLVLPSEHVEVAVTLWIAATHAAPWLHFFPRLAIRSPEKRCGKSRLLDLVGALCHQPIPTANISPAVLYRVMGGEDPHVLLIDEADTIWGTRKQAENNEDLRGLVNAGFERGRPTMRYDAAARKVEKLETFGFVALAGIGALPDTITDRSVNITMRRRQAGEKVAAYRARRDGEPLTRLAERLHDWTAIHAEQIQDAEPDLPVDDRAGDVWESLVILADLAGGPWPLLARQAAVALSSEHDQDDAATSDALRLLEDIRETFAEMRVAFLPSRELVNRLRGIEDSPWGDWDLSVVKLAARLRAYRIAPRRNESGATRGYRLEDFADTFARYLAPVDVPHASEPVKASEPQVRAPEPSDGLTGQGVRTSEPVRPLSSQSDGLTGADDSQAQTADTRWSVELYDREGW